MTQVYEAPQDIPFNELYDVLLAITNDTAD